MTDQGDPIVSDTASSPARSGASGGSGKKTAKPGFFARIVLFIREIFSELRISTRPTRSEWWALVLVVLVFVAVIMVYVGALDVVFAKVISWIFG